MNKTNESLTSFQQFCILIVCTIQVEIIQCVRFLEATVLDLLLPVRSDSIPNRLLRFQLFKTFQTTLNIACVTYVIKNLMGW